MKYNFYPNVTDQEEFVLYDKKEDKIIQKDFNRPPKIYIDRSEARKDTKEFKGSSVVNVHDLPLHQQDFLIRQYNENIKYIKE